MKNLQTFSEFVNESESINEANYYTLADQLADAGEHAEDEKEQTDIIMKALGANADQIASVSTEDEDTKLAQLFAKIHTKYSAPGKTLYDIGWGRFSYDKKINVVQMDDQGITAYYFVIK